MEIMQKFDWERYGFRCHVCGTTQDQPVILARVKGTRDTRGNSMVAPVHVKCLTVSIPKQWLQYNDNVQGQQAQREIEQSYIANRWHNKEE